ncbi:MAG: EamA family transporter [Pseudomonadota bacterium]
MPPNGLALCAIALWATLAALSVALAHLPPFLLTGAALLIGSLPGCLSALRQPTLWKVPPGTLAMGVGGLFGYHFLLFIALRHAPAVQANLVNYLWPLFIVVLAPLVLPGVALRPRHLGAAAAGFAGAALAILGGGAGGAAGGDGGWAWGYLPAFGAALAWGLYSLLTRRVAPFSTAAVGLFALVSGLLSLLCHAVLEPAVTLGTRDLLLLAAMGLGPLGAAFYLWDAALKRGDPRQIGVLSYFTPLASTALLLATTGQAWHWSLAAAALLILGGAFVATRSRN